MAKKEVAKARNKMFVPKIKLPKSTTISAKQNTMNLTPKISGPFW
jgi:hypothetical protein